MIIDTEFIGKYKNIINRYRIKTLQFKVTNMDLEKLGKRAVTLGRQYKLFGDSLLCIYEDNGDLMYVTNTEFKCTEDISALFAGLFTLESIDMRGLNTSSVHSFRNLFAYCSNLKTIDIRGLTTINVENVASMFEGCNSLQEIDLGNHNFSNINNANRMFKDCKDLERVKFCTKYNTRNMKSMAQMFAGCSNLRSLSISHIQTEDTSCNVMRIFENCNHLEYLNIRGLTYDGTYDQGDPSIRQKFKFSVKINTLFGDINYPSTLKTLICRDDRFKSEVFNWGS